MRRGPGGDTDPARLELEAVELAEHGFSAFDDRRLLGEDQFARGAQDLRVFAGDVGERHDRRVDDVGRVKPAAEPGFERGGLHTALRERQ